jgi:hypothetical protein
MMTTSPLNGTEVVSDLPRITLPRTSTHASRQAERPHTVPTIDQMLTEAQEHRARCERLLEALGAPVTACATTTSSKES